MSSKLKTPLEIAFASDANVLITGPTGSGKSRVARQIHDTGRRRGRPFIAVNLATLHEGTLESELFGHERGSFTGADFRRMGRLEAAQGGTVFLDEVGELNPRLQARLLEFLQSRTIVPVGGNREMKLDVRVIAATNKDLLRASERGEFRIDLFHRLQVISLEMKSLINREEEFDLILHSCLEEICCSLGRSILKISEDFAQKMEEHHWPGNIRELRNVLEYAVLACDGQLLEPKHLPHWFKNDFSEPKLSSRRLLGVVEVSLSLNYEECLSRFEKEYLERALRRFRGRINYTARQIGINKTTLLRRMRTHGLCGGAEEEISDSAALRIA